MDKLPGYGFLSKMFCGRITKKKKKKSEYIGKCLMNSIKYNFLSISMAHHVSTKNTHMFASIESSWYYRSRHIVEKGAAQT